MAAVFEAGGRVFEPLIGANESQALPRCVRPSQLEGDVVLLHGGLHWAAESLLQLSRFGIGEKLRKPGRLSE